MKFALALIASLAYTVKVEDLRDDLEDSDSLLILNPSIILYNDDMKNDLQGAESLVLYEDMTFAILYNDEYRYCGNEFLYEHCSGMWYQPPCYWQEECGWVYEDYLTLETFWVSCDDYDTWEYCSGLDYQGINCEGGDNDEWNWENCSQNYWRYPCDWEVKGDEQGWFYQDAEDISSTWPRYYWVSSDDYATWADCVWCQNEWIWDDCSQKQIRDPCHWEEIERDEQGKFYREAETWDEYWISDDDYTLLCIVEEETGNVDEVYEETGICNHPWQFDECAQVWWREFCATEGARAYGWDDILLKKECETCEERWFWDPDWYLC